MKYRDPQTGEFKDITVKVSDTLPVRTIVEYDGTTIPNGWELVDESGTYKKIKKTATTTATNVTIVDSLAGSSTTDAPSVNAVNNTLGVLDNLNTANKSNLVSAINEVNNKFTDTGWVDMTSYLNTAYFSVREGFTPMARKINGIVYWQGAVYCSNNVNGNFAEIFSNLPEWVCPSYEFNNGSVKWTTTETYNIFIDNTKRISIGQAGNINAVSDHTESYILSLLSGYIVD